MIVRLTQWRAKEGIGREEALNAWARHAEIVERLPGLRRYVQNHAIEAPDGSESSYVGVGEAWFDDVDTARAALASDEWADVIQDAGTFMNLESVVAVWAEPRLTREL